MKLGGLKLKAEWRAKIFLYFSCRVDSAAGVGEPLRNGNERKRDNDRLGHIEFST